ncbi:tyrosine-type recombinase/integrase [Chloroflexota bacterium]
MLPSLTKEQVETLTTEAWNVRDKAIISLFTESGLRLSELASIKLQDIDWDNHIE